MYLHYMLPKIPANWLVPIKWKTRGDEFLNVRVKR